MSTEVVPDPNKSEVIPDPAEHNAKVAAQVRDQDISGQPTATGEFGEATEALDKLAAKVAAKPAAPPTPAKVEPPAEKPETPPEKPVEKPAAETPPGPDPEVLKRADEFFKDSPKLPPNASPKSAEAFSSIKLRAAQEISAREQEIQKLKQDLESAKRPSPEILEKDKELEELRTWRAKVDVDFDPKFKEFDKSIEQQREFIYAQLSKNPAVTPDIIAQIKKFGGPDQIILTKLFESIKDPTLQRLVESKVADIEMAKYNKEQAIKAAKENLGQYIKERQEAQTKTTVANAQKVTQLLSDYLDKLDWYADKAVDEKADEATKKEIQEHNALVKQVREGVAASIADDSPEMKAILIAGMAQFFNLKSRVPVLETKLAAAEKSLAEVTAKWEAVKNASRSRLNESAAPSGGIPQPKPGTDVNTRAEDALDNLARQVMEKRAQASAGQ